MVWITWANLYRHRAANSHRFPLDLQHFWLQLPAWDLCVITVLGVICQVRRLTSRSRNLHSGVPQTFILKGNVSLSYQKRMRDKLTVMFSEEIVKNQGCHGVLHDHLSYNWRIIIKGDAEAYFRCQMEVFLRLWDSIVCVIRTSKYNIRESEIYRTERRKIALFGLPVLLSGDVTLSPLWLSEVLFPKQATCWLVFA